jgi:hypothetical protein
MPGINFRLAINVEYIYSKLAIFSFFTEETSMKKSCLKIFFSLSEADC